MKCIPLIAIISITSLAVIALCLGFDGALLASSFAIIGGLGGYEAKRARDNRKGADDTKSKIPLPK